MPRGKGHPRWGQEVYQIALRRINHVLFYLGSGEDHEKSSGTGQRSDVCRCFICIIHLITFDVDIKLLIFIDCLIFHFHTDVFNAYLYVLMRFFFFRFR